MVYCNRNIIVNKAAQKLYLSGLPDCVHKKNTRWLNKIKQLYVKKAAHKLYLSGLPDCVHKLNSRWFTILCA